MGKTKKAFWTEQTFGISFPSMTPRYISSFGVYYVCSHLVAQYVKCLCICGLILSECPKFMKFKAY